jgi:phosphoribosylformylglycinamidine cyclo-ligase
VRSGDVLIGIASSGLHSNGYSLVRRVVKRAKLKLRVHVDELGCTLGEELLRPTLIYAKVVGELFDRFKINGLANITGGGVLENLPRVMPKDTRAIIERGSWPTPPIFGLLQRLGKIDRAEMDRTFNNGLGMVAIVPAREADRVVAHLRRREFAAYVVGEVTRGKRGVSVR